MQQQAIRTSCLGFGPNYNEDLMTAMAQVSGGQFYDADAPERFPAIFESELDGLQKLTVQNLRLRLRRLDFCEAVQPLTNCPAVERPEGWTDLPGRPRERREPGGVLRAQGAAVTVGGWPPGRQPGGERLLEVEIVYDEIGETEIASRTVTQVMRIQATQNPGDVRQKVEVIPWVAMQRAGQVMQEVTRRLDVGRMDEAIDALNQAIASLKSYGPGAAVGEAVQQLESLLGRIQSGHWSLRERKLRRYQSHSYQHDDNKRARQARERNGERKRRERANERIAIPVEQMPSRRASHLCLGCSR